MPPTDKTIFGNRHLTIIAAVDEERGLGLNGKIPWRCREDMEHFKAVTTGGVVIMGRKTWDSLPPKFKPLPLRKNVVISKLYSKNRHADGSPWLLGVPVFPTPFSALNGVMEYTPPIPQHPPQLFVIGGATIYKAALELDTVSRVILTTVKGKYNCDCFFPELDQHFVETSSAELSPSARVQVFEWRP